MGAQQEGERPQPHYRYSVTETSFVIQQPTKADLAPLIDKLAGEDIAPKFLPIAQRGMMGLAVALHTLTDGDQDKLDRLYCNPLFVDPTDAFINPALYQEFTSSSMTPEQKLIIQSDLLIGAARVATKLYQITEPHVNELTNAHGNRIKDTTHTLQLPLGKPEQSLSLRTTPSRLVAFHYRQSKLPDQLKFKPPSELRFAIQFATDPQMGSYGNVQAYPTWDNKIRTNLDAGETMGPEGFGRSSRRTINDLTRVIEDINRIANTPR